MLKRTILVLALPITMFSQDAPKLMTKSPNLVSSNRAEVNSGHIAHIPVLEKTPEINNSGDLSDWAKAYRVEKACMPYLPIDKGEPRFRVDIYLAWGKDGLYVAAEVFGNPNEIVGSLQARDRDQTSQDQISIQIDPQGKGNSAVTVGVNSRNVQLDSSYVEGGGVDTSYDMIWKSGTALTPSGWVAKVKIPFSSVRRSPQDWFFSVTLSTVRDGVTYYLNYPQGYLDVQCNICQSIRLAGAPLQNDANVLMVAPRLYQARVGSLANGTMQNPEVSNKNGVDFRYQATSYSLEGTYKPDFATIESDVNPLYINNRYKYLYPDKRPFFMNGMDVFGDFSNGALNILATRSIIDPDYGLKGNGQLGSATWNVMQTRDAHGGDSISSDGIASVQGRPTSDTAFGTSIGFGSGTTISKVSITATDREVLGGPVVGTNNGGEHMFSRSVGLSLYQQLGQNWSVNAQGVDSYAALPSTAGEGVPRNGSGTSLSINANYGNFNFSANNTALNPNLRLDMGFIGLAGIRENLISGTYIIRNSGFWTSQSVGLVYDKINDWYGEPVLESAKISYVINLKGPTTLTIVRGLSMKEWWMQQEFVRSATSLSASYSGLSTAFVQAKINLLYSHVQGIDYSRVSADLEKIPQVLVTMNIGPVYLNAQWQERSIYDRASGALNVRATRLFLFVEQVLPHDFFWRVQYQPIRYYYPLDTNPGMATDTTQRRSTQYLIGWRPNPFSGFYLGYNATRGTVPTIIDPQNEPLIDKGLFMKTTYAFTF